LQTAKKIKISERPLLRSMGEINTLTSGGFYLAMSGGFYSAKPPCHSERHSIQ